MPPDSAPSWQGNLQLLPIFPLNTVLFPGGLLPLRIFEARYMDMVRACMREARDFGVCLIRKGREVGRHDTEPETIGCRARISDWDMEQLGLLQIATVGADRFRITRLSSEADGLLVAATEPLDDEAALSVPVEFEACTTLLERIIGQIERETARERAKDPPRVEVVGEGGGASDDKRPIAAPYRLDDASWVGNRLCELLPISLAAKQKLMELTDAPTRLAIVHQYLKQQKII